MNVNYMECEQLVEVYRETGDRQAVEQVLAMNAKILNHIVRRHARSSSEPFEDLLQVGNVGLIKAIDGYDTDSKAKFSSYAYAMIDGELRHHFRDTALLKRPRWARSLYCQVSSATDRLSVELGHPPSVEEIATEVNVTPEGILELMKLFSDTNVASLDESRSEESVDFSAIKSRRYEALSLPIEDRIWLEQSLESLTELQRKVVHLFFYKDLSQTEVGKRLGLPQRKISRVIASAVKSLSKTMTR